MTKSLCCPDISEEGIDFRAQGIGLAPECAGGGQYLAGSRSGMGRRGADADDVAGNLAGAAGGVLDDTGNLARRRALLFNRRRNRGGDIVDLADGLADVSDG